jgi:hypothetical protein
MATKLDLSTRIQTRLKEDTKMAENENPTPNNSGTPPTNTKENVRTKPWNVWRKPVLKTYSMMKDHVLVYLYVPLAGSKTAEQLLAEKYTKEQIDAMTAVGVVGDMLALLKTKIETENAGGAMPESITGDILPSALRISFTGGWSLVPKAGTTRTPGFYAESMVEFADLFGKRMDNIAPANEVKFAVEYTAETVGAMLRSLGVYSMEAVPIAPDAIKSHQEAVLAAVKVAREKLTLTDDQYKISELRQLVQKMAEHSAPAEPTTYKLTAPDETEYVFLRAHARAAGSVVNTEEAPE